jgi:deazaflavin-dependent oxidoreductase (nitroreductase family)
VWGPGGAVSPPRRPGPHSAPGRGRIVLSHPIRSAGGTHAATAGALASTTRYISTGVLVTLDGVADYYREPGWFTRNVFNHTVAFLTRQGISVLGSRVLAVKGRTSGQWRTTPVNLLSHDGRRYLVAPRGETQWVRNLRAVGTGELRLGKRAESFRGQELTDDEKVPVLRAYLKRWKAEIGIFFEGTGPDSSDDELRAIAPKHPAFEVLPVD